jgi:bifunctional DNA-binding transcriptional regulator/antitoxin component of YhaV-PrlF toxin-antitoxin module
VRLGVRRKYGLKDGDKVRIIDQGGLLIIIPLTDIKALHSLGAEHKEKLLIEVGIYKSKHKRLLSLAECFAMALSMKEKAQLLTTDNDFQEVKEIQVKYLPIQSL